MTAKSKALAYNTLIGADFREDNAYPEGLPALVIVHDSLEERARPHWHPGMEFIYCFRGSCPFFVDGRKIPLEAGDALLINPYSIHYGIPQDIGVNPLVLSVTFNDEVLQRVYPFVDRYEISINTSRVADDERDKLKNLAEQLLYWQRSDESIRGFKLNMLLYDLLSLVYSAFVTGVRKPEFTRSGRNITMQIVGYLTSHHTQKLDASMVAQEFGYSREHFCRIFHKATGETFKDFLTDLRLEDACRKLSSSSTSVARIAVESGFPDTRALQKAMQRKYAMSAQEYRIRSGVVPEQ